MRGFDGIQGPMYGGTGCFHRRKIIFGLPPDYDEIKGTKLSPKNGKTINLSFLSSITIVVIIVIVLIIIIVYVAGVGQDILS